jgi:predicted nucleotidyltransferase
MNQENLIAKIIPIISSRPNVHLAYLFGSQVQGNIGSMSDIDLGVLFTDDTDATLACIQLSHALAMALETDRVDVIPLNHAAIELAYAVIAQGKCIYQRDVATRVEFEADIMGRYGDYLPVLRAQRLEILRGEKHERRVQRYREAFRRTERTLSQIATPER